MMRNIRWQYYYKQRFLHYVFFISPYNAVHGVGWTQMRCRYFCWALIFFGWFTNNVTRKIFLTIPQQLKCQCLLCSCMYKFVFAYVCNHFHNEIILGHVYSLFSSAETIIALKSCSSSRFYSWNQLLKNYLSVKKNKTKKTLNSFVEASLGVGFIQNL